MKLFHALRERLRRYTDLLCLLPAAALLCFAFLIPLGSILFWSISNEEIRNGLPLTIKALDQWSGEGLPDEKVYRALLADLATSGRSTVLSVAAIRANYEKSGFRSLIGTTARNAARLDSMNAKDSLIQFDSRWSDIELWKILARNSDRFTSYYYLSAIDFHRRIDGGIERVAPDRRTFIGAFLRTLQIAASVTLLCLILGYPVAFCLAHADPKISNILLALVIVPFWTPLLVRVAAWIVLLQKEGLINEVLVLLGLVTRGNEVQLIYNRTGLLIAMTHVLLPFMILPLFSVMKNIRLDLMRAAASLGARPKRAFIDVYLPLSMPGVTTGALLVFITAIGYYVTPELVGGSGDQMISHFIGVYGTEVANWGQAAALGALLLVAVLGLYALYFPRMSSSMAVK